MPDFDPDRQTAETIAALVWDLPALRSGSASARDFAKALSGSPEKWWEPREFGGDPLGRAAQAAGLERGGRADDAVPMYQDLADSDEPWVRLLGLMLLAWSETSDDSAAARAQRAAEEIEAPPELRARLQAKAATFALDAEQVDLAVMALRRAVELAPKGSRLFSALAIEAANAGLGLPDRAAWPDEEHPFAQDQLVDYPWIHYAALDAAQLGVAAEVERNAERVWTWTLRFGGSTPLDTAVAAEVQATWAGALWLRRPIRRQLGAQLLSGEASQPRQWGYGIVMWALGEGKRPERIFRAAEPNLDQESVDFAVRNLYAGDWRPVALNRLLAVASEAFDVLSDETLRWLIELIEPQAGEHPTIQQVHTVWGGYAARFPEEWLRRTRTFPEQTQAALVRALDLPTLNAFARQVRRYLYDVLAEHLRAEQYADGRSLRIALEIAPHDALPDLADLIAARARPEAIAELARDAPPDLLTSAVLQEARDSLLRSIHADRVEAGQGTVSFGPGDARLALARLLVAMPTDPEAVGVLAGIAADPELPGEHILAARNGLALLRHAGKLPEDEPARWHNIEDPVGTVAEHGAVTEELARIRRLQILALELTPGEAVQVIAATRSPDRRVRSVSVEVCREAADAAADREERDRYIWALIGVLFDPLDALVARAVRALDAEMTARSSTAAEVALDRLTRLFEIGDRDVREAVVETAARLGSKAPGAVQDILSRAASDKSWRVRRAAGGTRGLQASG